MPALPPRPESWSQLRTPGRQETHLGGGKREGRCQDAEVSKAERGKEGREGGEKAERIGEIDEGA